MIEWLYHFGFDCVVLCLVARPRSDVLHVTICYLSRIQVLRQLCTAFPPHPNGTRPLWRARKTLPDDCDVIAMSAQLVPPLELPDCFLAPVVPPGVLSLCGLRTPVVTAGWFSHIGEAHAVMMILPAMVVLKQHEDGECSRPAVVGVEPIELNRLPGRGGVHSLGAARVVCVSHGHHEESWWWPFAGVVCSTADGAGHAALPEGRVLEVARAQGAAAAAHGGAGDLEGAHGVRVLEDGKVLGELCQRCLGLGAQGGVGGDGSCGRDAGDLHGGVRGSHLYLYFLERTGKLVGLVQGR